MKPDRNHELISCIVVKHLSVTNVNYPIDDNNNYSFKFDPKFDHWWHKLMSTVNNECEPVWLDAEDPLFILYTRLLLIQMIDSIFQT